MLQTFLSARWEDLIMINYPVKPSVLAPYLPHGVTLDFYHNQTYVSLVGFIFKKTSLFRIPVPFMGTFEEINLRFYVKRIDKNTTKRGVVFINETVPYRAVAWLANKLYKEHYTAVSTKSIIDNSGKNREISYDWKINNKWNHIAITTTKKNKQMIPDSIEEFIFEHYFGYTKINELLTQEYKVNHPRWMVSRVMNYSVECDFKAMYGNEFAFLNDSQPHSVIHAAGSPVTVNWKRTRF